jgi:hypothetical protein
LLDPFEWLAFLSLRGVESIGRSETGPETGPEKDQVRGIVSRLGERIQPADVLGVIGLVVIAILYGITREDDLKAGLLSLVMFLAGRQSQKTAVAVQ